MNQSSAWPIVGFERCEWISANADGMSRRSALKHRGSFDAAVPGFIADCKISISANAMALADEAGNELTRFDAEAGHYFIPFTSILLRSEAASSSQIENLTASPTAIFKAELGLKESPNARLVVSNQRALESAVSIGDPLDLNAILRMHELLLGESAPHIAGRLRKEQGWIGGSNFGPHGAAYIAPKAERVNALMSDWVKFSNRLDIPAVIQVAIAHAQFETIHPFADGNGRTGRALIHAMLHRLGVIQNVAIPISAGLLLNTNKYFEALENYRSADLDSIVKIVAEASLFAVQQSRKVASAFEVLQATWLERIDVRSDATALKLVNHLFKQPLITSQQVVQQLGVTPRSANFAIEKLVELGILEQLNSGARNRIWVAEEIIQSLDSFSDWLRR